jgi:tRNA dimethylallyltransferase
MAARIVAERPLIVIVGPTASGKTSLAIDVAKKFGGEIISADSRAVYKGMDIGTAKPTAKEREEVPHWGLDLVEPNERFTAVDFKRYALQKIYEIRARGHVPILVGGTGLYVDAVVFDYQFGHQTDHEKRPVFDAMTLDALHEYCFKNNVVLPENNLNKRYVIRAIEQKDISTKRRGTIINNTIIVGIATYKENLQTRIKERIEQMLDKDVVEEATLLSAKYGWESEAMTASIYRLIHSYLEGGITLIELKERAIVLDWRLAKRQLTWLRRNKAIQWLSREDAGSYLLSALANE